MVVVGGGLAGALMSVSLARDGFEVDAFEMRDDLRSAQAKGGRSINLAISHRGIDALRRVGLAEVVLQEAVPMRGRMIHSPSGALTFQPYGTDPTQVINSVSRAGLNRVLLEAAASRPNVNLHFNQRCTDLDLETGMLFFTDTRTAEVTTVKSETIIGADGAFSAVRQRMQRMDRFHYHQEYLEHGYKELTIPPAPGGGFRMEPRALHIWPRRSFMLIALPNADGSYTCTLFLALEGEVSFASLDTPERVMSFFRAMFPDALPLMPTLTEDFFRHATGSLVTIRCGPWFCDGRAVLIGDACHAVVPFYGQGMNAAFEDVVVLHQVIQRELPDWNRAFAEFYEIRKPHTDTLAALAIENFIEMRDHTGKRTFRFRKKLEKTLHRMFPKWYVPLYTLVTFTRTPYAQALQRSRRQDRIVVFCAVVAVLAAVLALWMAIV